jgi:hypothetical protein
VRSRRFFGYRSFGPQPETLRRLAGFGVDTITIFPSNTVNSFGVPYSEYGPMWLGPKEYDFTPLDREVAAVGAVAPRMKIICMVDLNTPLWWVRRNQGVADGADSFSELGRIVSCPEWRCDTTDWMRAFLEHAEARYREAIVAYMLTAGNTCEWQDRTCGRESTSRRAAFRSWSLAAGQEDPVDIPPASIRERVSHDLLRDPVRDGLALRYWRFCNEQVGDAILHFAHEAQAVLNHRAEVGVFYGYALELGKSRLVSEGHLDYERIARSRDIDFFVAPATYVKRQVGHPPAFLSTVDTFRLAGKGFVQEIDHRTHTARPPPGYSGFYGIWNTTAESVAGLRREFAWCLIEDVSFWWFDMWGGFYDDPAVMADLSRMKRLWDELHPRQSGNAAQVAVVFDPESALLLDQSDPRVDEFARSFRGSLGCMGAPYRAYSFGDLDTLDLAPYKLLIFPNVFVVDEHRRELLRRRILCDGRTVLWLDRPGVIADGRYDDSGVEKCCGIAPGQGRAVTRRMAGWTSVLAPLPAPDSATLREIARNAGVHIYCDSGDPLDASGDLLVLHTALGGALSVRLRQPCDRVIELFSGRVVAERTSCFMDKVQGPATVLYRLDPGMSSQSWRCRPSCCRRQSDRGPVPPENPICGQIQRRGAKGRARPSIEPLF